MRLNHARANLSVSEGTNRYLTFFVVIWVLGFVWGMSGGSMFVLDQWREWQFALRFVHSGFDAEILYLDVGRYPLLYQLFLLPITLFSEQVTQLYLIPSLMICLVAGIAVLYPPSFSIFKLPFLVGMLCPAGIFYVFFGGSTGYSYLFAVAGLSLWLQGRIRLALILSGLSAAVFYEGIPVFALVFLSTMYRWLRSRDNTVFLLMLVATLVGLSYVTAPGVKKELTYGGIGGIFDALLYLHGGILGIGLVSLVLIWKWRTGVATEKKIVSAIVFLAALNSFGLSFKSDYWSFHHQLYVMGITGSLFIVLLQRYFWGRALSVIIIGVSITLFVVVSSQYFKVQSDTGILRKAGHLKQNSGVSSSWSALRSLLDKTENIRAVGEVGSLAGWAHGQAGKDMQDEGRVLLLSKMTGPWCNPDQSEALCAVTATIAATAPVSGEYLLEIRSVLPKTKYDLLFSECSMGGSHSISIERDPIFYWSTSVTTGALNDSCQKVDLQIAQGDWTLVYLTDNGNWRYRYGKGKTPFSAVRW